MRRYGYDDIELARHPASRRELSNMTADEERAFRLAQLAKMAIAIRDFLHDDPRDNSAYITAEVLARQLSVMAGIKDADT